MSVAGVVLAAGGSSRLGRPKQLVDVGGEPLVRRSLRAVLASGCMPVALVVGSNGQRVAAASEGLRMVVLVNEDWQEGIASSIRVAAAWADSIGSEGLLLALCDQPLLTKEHLAGLLAAFAREKRCVGSAYDGAVGAPAVFARTDLRALGELKGDRGAGRLLASSGAPGVEWPEGAIDIDTDEDVATYLA